MPYTHFTSDERDALQVLKAMDLGMDIIGRLLGRHPLNRPGFAGDSFI